jgi:hypothetical protein
MQNSVIPYKDQKPLRRVKENPAASFLMNNVNSFREDTFEWKIMLLLIKHFEN